MTVNSQASTLELYGKWGYYTLAAPDLQVEMELVVRLPD
ncbi:MAG: hypothetical protein Rsou_1771 [Candidatus Ruthia sp. Asou_11_S2]|nr:hypothetical protein [Candidatus Ruthia sp. Asou_11_S2]